MKNNILRIIFSFSKLISKLEKLHFKFGKRRLYVIDFAAFLFCLLFITAGAVVSINRYYQYDVFYYDFGIFDSAIWNISRFKPPIIEHLTVGGKVIFADHFSPSIYFLSPLYWITDRSEIILIAQAAIVGLSGFVLYKTGLNILKNKLLSFSILTSYFLFVGLQNAVISDFHEVTIMTLPLMLLFWSIIKNKIKLFFISLLITLGFKESTFLLGIGLGIFIFLMKREWRKISLITILVSIIWGIITIKFIIPYFSGGSYYYGSQLPVGLTEKVTMFFNHEHKRKTLFYSFASFGFLPVFSPSFWFLLYQDFLVRFIPEGFPTRWQLGLHYSAQLAVIMSISSIYSLGFLRRFNIFNKMVPIVALVLIINAFILYRFTLNGPFGLFYNPAFYKHSNEFAFLDNMIDKIPKNAVIMTHNNIASKFTHQRVWFIKGDYAKHNPDYILFDIREGQNPNNFFGSADYLEVLDVLKFDPDYSIIYQTEKQFIFKKKN